MDVYSTKHVEHFYAKPLHEHSLKFDKKFSKIEWEFCYNVEVLTRQFTAEDKVNLRWLMNAQIFETTQGECVTEVSRLSTFPSSKDGFIVEVGPRLHIQTPFSTNALSICRAIGITAVTRIEKSVRYRFECVSVSPELDYDAVKSEFITFVLDPMTQCEYENPPLTSFEQSMERAGRWERVDVCSGTAEEAKLSLSKYNDENGLTFDEDDVRFYTELFRKMNRNPTTVELFDLAQSNSEHSRHWFFNGSLVVDGRRVSESLMDMVKQTGSFSMENNVIKFGDNSSAIEGFEETVLRPKSVDEASPFEECTTKQHLALTAETHNFPTAISPFSGATTGTGGRIRDVQAVGRGGNPIAGTVGYSVGNLNIPGYPLEWEYPSFKYTRPFARPLTILIEGSDGCSDYGNKFGEPVVCGFTRSFGQLIGNEKNTQRREEYYKPVLFSGGVGTLDDNFIKKMEPKKGMKLVKVGGPPYRIGVGGGSASSRKIQGGEDNAEDDLKAVQRGDPEMEQKMNRVIRACIESPNSSNPIASIHDQGAGGNGNVLKELVEPVGAIIFAERLKSAKSADSTLSALELWCAEYQESNAILCEAEDVPRIETIGARERCPVDVVGTVTGDGKVIFTESKPASDELDRKAEEIDDPVNLKLEDVLQKRRKVGLTFQRVPILRQPPSYAVGERRSPKLMSTKERMCWIFRVIMSSICIRRISAEPVAEVLRPEYKLKRQQIRLDPLPESIVSHDLNLPKLIEKVLRHPTVCSKRFLTNKVDRSVTGLVALQQCVGPFHTPISDAAVVTLSVLGDNSQPTRGIATSIGEQPIKGIIDPAAGARMAVAEALTNLTFVPIDCIEKIKCSANWMWPSKADDEGARLYDACVAMCEIMSKLGVAVDGGKDSLSMTGYADKEIIRAPGTLVVSNYATCIDVRKIVTADLKSVFSGRPTSLWHIEITPTTIPTKMRLGGSIFAQVHQRLGDEPADVDYPEQLKKAFNALQILVKEEKILAGHDVSDGGLITCVLEMAFAAGCGVYLSFQGADNLPQKLFNEECGWIIEVYEEDEERMKQCLDEFGVKYTYLGCPLARRWKEARLVISNSGSEVFDEPLFNFVQAWEETSYRIERLQCNLECAEAEFKSIGRQEMPPYEHKGSLLTRFYRSPKDVDIKVAVLREEGVNGDREMVAAFHMAGFRVYDVTMQDLLNKKTTLDEFRGLVFPGGFSFADVFGAAKGWASIIRAGDKFLRDQFNRFYRREDTFSFGVCNGCQLMCLLGWVGNAVFESERPQPRIAMYQNKSGRFESRFSTVKIYKSPSIMLSGLENSCLGVWVAHGEGRLAYSDVDVEKYVKKNNLIAIKYVQGKIGAQTGTESYPANPNGSPDGAAGICSLDGRHLAMMPHPERCVKFWQWPYVPLEWKMRIRDEEKMALESNESLQFNSPWLRMFINAYNWCKNSS